MPEPANRSQGQESGVQGSGVSQREWNDMQSVLDEELSRLPTTTGRIGLATWRA